MRVLTLDDMHIRQRCFARWFMNHEHVHAWTAPGAIRELEGPVFDLAMLDHDLAEEHYLTASEGLSEDPLPGAPVYAPGTGMDVVDHIVKMAPDRRPKKVIVHSLNPVRGQEMFNRLREAGVAVWRIPFNPGMPIRLG